MSPCCLVMIDGWWHTPAPPCLLPKGVQTMLGRLLPFFSPIVLQQKRNELESPASWFPWIAEGGTSTTCRD